MGRGNCQVVFFKTAFLFFKAALPYFHAFLYRFFTIRRA